MSDFAARLPPRLDLQDEGRRLVVRRLKTWNKIAVGAFTRYGYSNTDPSAFAIPGAYVDPKNVCALKLTPLDWVWLPGQTARLACHLGHCWAIRKLVVCFGLYLASASVLQIYGQTLVMPWFYSGDITNLSAFAAKLINRSDSVSQFLDAEMSSISNSLAKWHGGMISDSNLEAVLVRHLNDDILTDVSIYNAERFRAVKLRPETKSLIDKNPSDNELLLLNRLLLEDAYPFELSRQHALRTNSPPEGISPEEHAKLMRDMPLYKYFSESPGIEVKTRQFLARIKAKNNPEDLLRWADAFLKAYARAQQSVRLPQGQVPDFILNLDPPLKPNVTVFPTYVSIDWGGGFGFWGLCIGEKNRPDNPSVFVLEWVPGVYAYHTRDL